MAFVLVIVKISGNLFGYESCICIVVGIWFGI